MCIFVVVVRPAAGEPPPPPGIVVSGSPAVVEAPGLCEDNRTFSFRIRAPQDPVKNVIVSASGLADVTFDHGADKKKAFLVIPSVSTQDEVITVHVPDRAFPRGGTAAAAKLTIWTAKGLIEVPVSLGGNIFVTAMTWFLGFFIPAAVAGLLTYGGFLMQQSSRKRADERTLREQTLRDFYDDIRTYFSNLYVKSWQVSGNDPEEWGAKVRAGLKKAWLAGISTADNRELEEALAEGEKNRVMRILKRIFPQHEKKIDAILDIPPDE